MPRDPKPSATRRRRNVDATAAKLEAGDRAVRPEPPEGLLAETLVWWEKIWASPMARVWLESDAPEIVLMARLQDRVNAGDFSATLLGELRQLKDRFGLSPLARRRLAWELEQAQPASGEEPVASGEDDGRWLRVV